MNLDPATNNLAVTGGEDDKAYVWRVSDGEVVLECTGKYSFNILTLECSEPLGYLPDPPAIGLKYKIVLLIPDALNSFNTFKS